MTALGASDEAYDIVIVDHSLCQACGDDLKTSLRAMLRGASLLVLAPMSDRRDSHCYRDAGFAGWVTKPVRPSQLKDALETARRSQRVLAHS
jgi:DNA-binding response OmpR family regulator